MTTAGNSPERRSSETAAKLRILQSELAGKREVVAQMHRDVDASPAAVSARATEDEIGRLVERLLAHPFLREFRDGCLVVTNQSDYDSNFSAPFPAEECDWEALGVIADRVNLLWHLDIAQPGAFFDLLVEKKDGLWWRAEHWTQNHPSLMVVNGLSSLRTMLERSVETATAVVLHDLNGVSR